MAGKIGQPRTYKERVIAGEFEPTPYPPKSPLGDARRLQREQKDIRPVQAPKDLVGGRGPIRPLSRPRSR